MVVVKVVKVVVLVVVDYWCRKVGAGATLVVATVEAGAALAVAVVKAALKALAGLAVAFV